MGVLMVVTGGLMLTVYSVRAAIAAPILREDT
jgi:hypothetical protein